LEGAVGFGIELHFKVYDDEKFTNSHYDRPRNLPGKPCVRGLRYPVKSLLELLSSGMTMEEILADNQDLERDDLLAVLASEGDAIQQGNS